jgi:hypothetical protein
MTTMYPYPLRATPNLLNIDGLIYIISNSYECQDVLNFANLNNHYRGLFKENYELIYREIRKRGLFYRNSPNTVDSYQKLVNTCFESDRINFINDKIATGMDLTDLLKNNDKLRAALLGNKSYKEYNKLTPNLSTTITILDNNTSKTNEKIEREFLKARLEYVKFNVAPPIFDIGEYDTTIEGYYDMIYEIFPLHSLDIDKPGDIIFIDTQNRPVAHLNSDFEWVYITEEYEPDEGPYENSENIESLMKNILDPTDQVQVQGEFTMVEYIDNVRQRYQYHALAGMRSRNN